LKLLLINSNESNAFAAVYNDGELIITYAVEFSPSHELSPRIKTPDRLIDCLDDIAKKCIEKNIELNNIDAVSVITGPGSFTGIRVGLSIAKGFADALDKKIIPIDNFSLTFNRIEESVKSKIYCVVIPAKLPEYYFRLIKNGVELETGFFFANEISTKINENATLVGDFSHESEINLNYFNYINVANLKSETDSMTELSLMYFKEGTALSSNEIEPLYIKDFVAKKKQF
jgi:tRNA threonylcarbamoyladenosine biosynthesis protein TsaB